MADKEQQGAVDQEKLAEEWANQADGGAKAAAPEGAKAKPKAKAEPKAQSPSFDELSAEKGGSAVREIDFLLDIPLVITVELGRTKMLINDLLQLGQGSVVELDKVAGEPMDIFINGKLVARGEVVVVNEKFGIRLTDIISPTERLKQLR